MTPKNSKFFIDIRLNFFADSSSEKTEQPTAKKKKKAREEGQVAKSPDVALAVMLITVFSALRALGGNIYNGMVNIFHFNLVVLQDLPDLYDAKFTSNFINYTFTNTVVMLLPLFGVAMLVGIITNLVQVKWKPTTKPLKPKLSKLNPINGAKKLFKLSQLVELLKSLLKFSVIGIVLYMVMEGEIENLPNLHELALMDAVLYVGDLIINLGVTVGVIYIFIAAADYFYARYRHIKSIKMTKQEVKEEYKEIEGNPQIKGKIRQKMREVSMRRMMQNLPKADVIITNPTHYAVALSYNRSGNGAPTVIAKGADYVAKRIREYAMNNDITIVENRQLARTLFQVVEIGQEIPPELYQAVAEVLAYVYKLKNKVS